MTPNLKTVLDRAVFFMVLLALNGCKGLLEPVPVATSPDEKTVVSMQVRDGKPYFKVDRNNQDILLLSFFDLRIDNENILSNVKWGIIEPSFTREAWQTAPGTDAYIQDVYNEMAVQMLDAGRGQAIIKVRFRCYNEGIAYRFELDSPNDSTMVDYSELRTQKLKLNTQNSIDSEIAFETMEEWKVQLHQAPTQSFEYEWNNAEEINFSGIRLQDSLLFRPKTDSVWGTNWKVVHINQTWVDTKKSTLLLNLMRD